VLRPSGLTIGALICMDCEYPEPARILALRGAQLLLIPTALVSGRFHTFCGRFDWDLPTCCVFLS
jgi:predicted amidohydrolase